MSVDVDGVWRAPMKLATEPAWLQCETLDTEHHLLRRTVHRHLNVSRTDSGFRMKITFSDVLSGQDGGETVIAVRQDDNNGEETEQG